MRVTATVRPLRYPTERHRKVRCGDAFPAETAVVLDLPGGLPRNVGDRPQHDRRGSGDPGR